MKTKKIYYLILILCSMTFLGCDSEDDENSGAIFYVTNAGSTGNSGIACMVQMGNLTDT
jgi:hypothetical protein